jgi:hypothetical protein
MARRPVSRGVLALLSANITSNSLPRRGRINKVALRHYIDCFDFSGLRLDFAFRFVRLHCCLLLAS